MRISLLCCLALCSLATVNLRGAPPETPKSEELLREAREKYRAGNSAEALPLFEKAIEQGASGGEVFYQAAFCLRAAGADPQRVKEYMTRALPLVEAELSDGRTPAPYYYAGAIYGNELADRQRAVEVATLGIQKLDSGGFDLSTGEAHFQVARLYTILGREPESLKFYEKAAELFALESKPPVEIQRQTLDQLARAYLARGDYAAAAKWYSRRATLGALSESDRFRAGMAMLQGGLYDESLKALDHFEDPAIAVEANYIRRVVSKNLELGIESRPDWMTIDESALLGEMQKAAMILSDTRSQDEETVKAQPVPEPPFEWRTTRKGVRYKHYLPYVPYEGWAPVDPDNPTLKEQAILRGEIVVETPAAPPLSPARLAAERDFYGLLLVYLQRGRLLREAAVQYGFAALIFK